MRHYLTFAGTDLRSFGIYISGKDTYGGAKRSEESISIPGRNGNLTIDNGKYENVTITYPAFIVNNFEANIADFRNFLASKTGYLRLEDTYHPDEFRLARWVGPFTPDVTDELKAGRFDLTFDCYPQRFLKSGEIEEDVVSGTIIRNPTNQTALPLLRVYGTGTLSYSTGIITILEADTYTDIDCYLMEAYKNNLSQSRNDKIRLGASGKFPSIPPTNEVISFSGNITRVTMKPRWWII